MGRFTYDSRTNEVEGPGDYMAARFQVISGRGYTSPQDLLTSLQADFEEWLARPPVQWVGGVGARVISR